MSPNQDARGAAVIVASRPLDPAFAATGFGGGKLDLPPALIRLGRVTLIEWVIIRFQLVGIAPIIVITGFENERLERHLARMGVVCLNNPDWKKSTLFDDAMMGLDYAERTCPACEKVLLATPLIPSVGKETLITLLASTAPVAVPVFEGKEGLPLAFHRELIAKIPRHARGKTLTDLVSLSQGPVAKITVSDPGILTGMDRPDDFPDQELAQGEEDHLPMRARLKLSLVRESVFFGPGPATLLRLIDETGSVRTACIRMKLSYSKGWQILNLLEEELGVLVIDRKTGGQEGGSSKLTATGRELPNRFEQLSFETQKSVNLLFDQIFRDFPPKEK
ncbi:MAG: NTP transferase domain-containing protein [Clostridiaceae bacterium]|nr:NTP transferase domain-containing protein [Clostridiaceae bacterium]